VLSVLLVASCAMLSGARSLVAIAEWADDAGQAVLARLGVDLVVPHESTLRRVLQAVALKPLDGSSH